jgi:hypothetical protein
MKETQVVSFEGGVFMARYQCMYLPLSSAAGLCIYLGVYCEFRKILYHPTVADTHYKNRIVNIPYFNTSTVGNIVSFPNTTFLPRKGNRQAYEITVFYASVCVLSFKSYLTACPIFMKHCVNIMPTT